MIERRTWSDASHVSIERLKVETAQFGDSAAVRETNTI